MAEFHCASCGYSKNVPDALAGKKAKCPKCGRKGVVGAAPQPDQPSAGWFSCPKCGLERKVKAELIGRKAKCPSCSEAVSIVALAQPPSLFEESAGFGLEQAPSPENDEGLTVVVKPPIEDDIDLGDLAGNDRLSARIETDEDREEFVIPSQAPATLARESRPFSLTEGNPLNNILAGLLSGALAFLFSLTFAAFIFSQADLTQFFPHAMGVVLTTAAIIGVVVAFGSWLPFSIAGPESTVSVALFLMVSAIQAQMRGAPPLAVYTTSLAAISLTAVVTGLGLILFGRLKAGAWIRYIPYQMVGGIMAAIGFFVLKGLWNSSAGTSICAQDIVSLASNWDTAKAITLLTSPQCSNLVPAVVFGLILMLLHSRARNSLVILLLALAATGAAHGYLHWQGIPMETAARDGFLYAPYPAERFWEFYDPAMLGLIDWKAILDNVGYITAMLGLVIATHMYKITKLEVELGREVDLDHEISNLGVANLLSGLAGGMPGNLSMGRSMGNRWLGARGPLAGIVAALFCGASVYFAGDILAYVPKFVPFGLLIMYGLSLLKRWLIKAKKEFTHTRDYVLLFTVFLSAVLLGFLPGLAIGLALALMLIISQSGKVRVVKHMLSGANYRSNVDRASSQLKLLRDKGGQISALKLQGFIFLGTINRLISIIQNRLDDPDQPPLRYILLDFTYVTGLDSTVTMSFTRLKQLAHENSMVLIFSSMSFDLEQQLEEGGFAINEPDHSSLSFIDLDHAMEWCENRILEQEGESSSDRKTLPQLLEAVFPNPELLPRLMEYLEEKQCAKDEYVFKQGDPSDAMYFLRSGMITIELEIDGYKKLRLKKLGPGTVFGEMGIYTSDPRSASALASEESILYKLSTARLEEMQDTDPQLVSAVHHFIVSLLAGRVAETNAKVRDLLQ